MHKSHFYVKLDTLCIYVLPIQSDSTHEYGALKEMSKKGEKENQK